MNINRDYLIILDVKSGEVDSPNIYYFNTDKNTSNLYVQMVLRETTVEATPIDNAAEYSIKANILKPNMVAKEVEGTLVNPGKAIYEFALPADCTDFSGNAKIEFEVYCTVDGVEEIATSFATKFKVHGSVLTEQNKYIEDSSDYPILKELMAEVKELNTQSKELNTDSRKLHEELSGALEAEEQRKANESDRIANENARETAEQTRQSAEATRIDNENSRIEAEKQREVIKQKLINDIEKLVLDTNKKVSDNLSDQNKKVTKLISDTETKIDTYKTEKNTEIDKDLQVYKENTTDDIKTYLDDYKNEKDNIINSKIEELNRTTYNIEESEKDRVKNETLRQNSESTRSKEFETIKSDYETYKNVMISESNVAALQNQINNNSSQIKEKANNDDLEVERKRIDSLTKLSEGSTSGDAELIDARVGQDGVIYDNLGTGIRTQFSNIKTGIETLSSVANIISIDKLSDDLAEGIGKYIDKYNLVLGSNAYRGACYIKNGKLASYTSENDHNRFTIVDVIPGQRLKISLRSHNTTNYHIILADKDDNVVAYYINDADKIYTDYELTIPKNVTKLGVNSYSYLPTILSYDIYSPIANQDYVNIQANRKITFDRLSNDLANGIGGYTEVTNLEFNKGACYIKDDKLTSYTSENDHNRFTIVDVIPGQRLKISLRSHNTTNYHIILADKDDNIIANYINDADQVYTDYELTIPKDVVKLGVNSYSYNATIKRYGMTSPLATQQFVLDTVNNLLPKGLEDYYNNDNYLDNKIAEIKNNTKVVSGVSFAFITDMHMYKNRLQSKYLLKEILDNTNVPFVVSGGDIVRAYGDKANIQEDVDKWYEYVKYLDGKMFNVHGNHDFTISSEDGTTGYTYDEYYNYDYIMREQETNVVCENGKLYYFFDNPAQKVRFIVLDGVEHINAGDNPWGAGIGISQEQYDWFINALTSITNYNIVVFSHQASDANLPGASGIARVQDILEALNNKTTYTYNNEGLNISVDFTQSTNICCCHICGHGHRDASSMTNNVLSIETTCDAHYWDDGYNAAQGTITEQAFDVFTIDTYNRTIKAVRIGRGNNREWSY